METQNPVGEGHPEVWFKTISLKKDLLEYYRWADSSGDSMKSLLRDGNGALYGEFCQMRENINTFDFHPSSIFRP